MIGYGKRSEDKKKKVHLVWKHTGGGSFDEARNVLQDNGVAFNSFSVSTTAGTSSQLSVQLAADEQAKSTIGNFITIPGAAASLDVSFDTERRAHVLEGSSALLSVTVMDAHGNLVGDDTSVNIRVTGDALIRHADDETEQSYEAGTRSGVATIIDTDNPTLWYTREIGQSTTVIE